MRKSDYILIIDSGSGGENVLNKLTEKFPNENFLFFKDINNCPYGNKSKNNLLKITKNNLNYLLSKYEIKMVIFACNTISSTLLTTIKNTFQNIYFLGMLPNIEEALKNRDKILVLSTLSTLKKGKIDKKYKNNINLKFYAFRTLAKKIDDNINNLNSLIPYLTKKLRKYKDYQNVVIGCTHFSLIKEQLKIALNKDVTFFDNLETISDNLKNTLTALSLTNRQNKQGKVIQITKIE